MDKDVWMESNDTIQLHYGQVVEVIRVQFIDLFGEFLY